MQYRIICTRKATSTRGGHTHIVSVGTGSTATTYDRLWAVADVLAAMPANTFYTVSPSTGKTALVEPFICAPCQRRYIRSSADAVTDNNLDNLPTCGS